jgi:hypothetical protein
MKAIVYHLSGRAWRLGRRSWLGSLLVGLTLALVLYWQPSIAQSLVCGFGGATCPLTGDWSPVSVEPAAPGVVAINAPGAPAFGALIYEDFVLLEKEARAKLKSGLEARLALSPYQGNVGFDAYVVKFDYAAGWSRTTSSGKTLADLINQADQDLRAARDLYGYLAVYAPDARFRGDAYYTGTPPSGFSAALCGVTNKEDPDPTPTPPTGEVLDPVIDWCDFTARLRQSVREAAYLRMIFGQQFMADALGLQFSGTTLLGAESAVRQEVARLDAAKYQYQLAESELNETLDLNLGSGCYISDFFTQSEWSLFSRAIEGQETAQHHLAVRQSYLDIPQQPDGPQQTRAAAVNALRAASTDGYIKLIGMAGLGAAQPTGAGCAKGVRPDGALAAEMALNLAETRRQAHEMSDGRNVFGFDVSFTPARRYTGDACGTATAGLYQDAVCAAQLAQQLQDAEATATREYNNSQTALRTEVQNIQNGIDAQIAEKSGCAAGDWACVDTQIAELNKCLEEVRSTVTTVQSSFDTCVNKTVIKNSAAKRALLDLRSVYIQQYGIVQKASNIHARITLSNDANVRVKNALTTKGNWETAARTSEAALNTTACMAGASTLTGWGYTIACGVTGTADIITQFGAGMASTSADVEVEDAGNHKETENLLLDQTELLIDAYAASQQFNSKYAEYQSLLDGLRDDVTEAQRQRAYFAHSPANDPSFRIVRDSTRLQFAKQLALATRLTYLTARRAEYEYAARLNASNVRFSDIYRSRTAADLLTFLSGLSNVTSNLPAGIPSNLNAQDLTYSVAQHWLHLTDAALTKEGFTTPAAIQTERTRRFRLWVAENTVPNTFESPYDGKPVLKFTLSSSLLEGGSFAQLIPQGYDGYWLISLGGIELPKPSSNGFSANLVSDQTGMAYRAIRVTQGGTVHLRSQAGCTFDYRLISPAALLGLEWASNQSAEVATASFRANVNEATPYTDNGLRTEAFQGRAASTTDWQVLVFSGAPASGMSDMELQKLTDLELNFSIIYASRTPGTPEPSACTRIDW